MNIFDSSVNPLLSLHILIANLYFNKKLLEYELASVSRFEIHGKDVYDHVASLVNSDL